MEYYSDQPDRSRKNPSVDYTEILSARDFAFYSGLRDLRKELAEKENIPIYSLFTNEQLAQMVRLKFMIPRNVQSVRLPLEIESCIMAL